MAETSLDGHTCHASVDHRTEPAVGSPVLLPPVEARFVHLAFPETTPGSELAVLEWDVF